MIDNLSLELENERNSNIIVTNEAIFKINQLQVEKALLRMECSPVLDEFDLHFSYCCEVHDALKQLILEKDSEIEDLNLQLTQIKNMEFSLKLDVMEGVLNDLYDISTFTNSVTKIGRTSFSKEVQ
ncbi:hypothetical protein L7F22_067372 [Adiantum nelumboides]|nr:hypothetical protein [Adiantum nelumboides]